MKKMVIAVAVLLVTLGAFGQSQTESIQISTHNINCGEVKLGQRSNNPDYFIIKNTGTVAVAVNIASNNPQFQVQQINCGLLPGQSCFVDITFAPSAVGLRSGVVTISKIEDGQSVAVNVSGRGI